MKRSIFLFLAGFFIISYSLFASVTIRYTNKDSKDYNMSVKIGGSSTKVKFSGSGTGSVTIQGGSDECVIMTSCGKVEVKSGDRITIQNGCIKVN
ncbi:hypothetical protein OO013_08695 [Mangrovivirga sp. M17]|uniref:DUF3060 domain-containing protein n=1 Tax=Mangrovivirga halotolerans TaxID=2993936 RepID=A0ABT3RQ76_9BACT|nr:hypothetical protein [Mangrovivirga halotolerans]MCX2743942.1 hypothetical protein [Mangrovivirga halotolerans]